MACQLLVGSHQIAIHFLSTGSLLPHTPALPCILEHVLDCAAKYLVCICKRRAPHPSICNFFFNKSFAHFIQILDNHTFEKLSYNPFLEFKCWTMSIFRRTGPHRNTLLARFRFTLLHGFGLARCRSARHGQVHTVNTVVPESVRLRWKQFKMFKISGGRSSRCGFCGPI